MKSKNEIPLAVDAVICITLSSRFDRRQYIENALTEFFPRLVFWEVAKDCENPVRGCYNSHRDIALHSLEQGFSNVLVFEDDALMYLTPSQAKAKKVNEVLASAGFDILYLGGILGSMWLGKKFGFVGAKLWCSHSYIMTKNGMQKLAAKPYSGHPIDYVYFNEFKAEAVFPLWFTQLIPETAASDIQDPEVKSRELASGMWKKNQRSQFHRLLFGTLSKAYDRVRTGSYG